MRYATVIFSEDSGTKLVALHNELEKADKFLSLAEDKLAWYDGSYTELFTIEVPTLIGEDGKISPDFVKYFIKQEI